MWAAGKLELAAAALLGQARVLSAASLSLACFLFTEVHQAVGCLLLGSSVSPFRALELEVLAALMAWAFQQLLAWKLATILELFVELGAILSAI